MTPGVLTCTREVDVRYGEKESETTSVFPGGRDGTRTVEVRMESRERNRQGRRTLRKRGATRTLTKEGQYVQSRLSKGFVSLSVRSLIPFEQPFRTTPFLDFLIFLWPHLLRLSRLPSVPLNSVGGDFQLGLVSDTRSLVHCCLLSGFLFSKTQPVSKFVGPS